jgi:hypothetical protein
MLADWSIEKRQISEFRQTSHTSRGVVSGVVSGVAFGAASSATARNRGDRKAETEE